MTKVCVKRLASMIITWMHYDDETCKTAIASNVLLVLFFMLL